MADWNCYSENAPHIAHTVKSQFGSYVMPARWVCWPLRYISSLNNSDYNSNYFWELNNPVDINTDEGTQGAGKT